MFLTARCEEGSSPRFQDHQSHRHGEHTQSDHKFPVIVMGQINTTRDLIPEPKVFLEP